MAYHSFVARWWEKLQSEESPTIYDQIGRIQLAVNVQSSIEGLCSIICNYPENLQASKICYVESIIENRRRLFIIASIVYGIL